MSSRSSRLRPVPTGLAFAGLAACSEGSDFFALETSGMFRNGSSKQETDAVLAKFL